MKGLAKRDPVRLVGHGIRRLRTRLHQFYKGGAMWRDRAPVEAGLGTDFKHGKFTGFISTGDNLG